jgi:hypothetical protein
MKDDLFLNDRYDCNNNRIFKRKINCIHWSQESSGCSVSCSLKNINPKELDCYMCKERSKIPNAELPQQITIENTKKYIKAETSQMIQGKVSDEVFEKRKQICMSCDKRQNINPETESIGWCNACGCGWKTRAALSQKLYIPTISCPLKKFGPELGSGFNLKSAAESISGIVTSIKQTLNSNDK